MPVVTAGAITAGATLLGAGIQVWANSAAQQEALRENRRAEKLRIKFAKEETEREERRFQKEYDLKKDGQNFNMMDSIIKNTQSMFMNNRAYSQQIANFSRSRR